MPQDRFIHPRLGHSQKVAQLTDLEFRVWMQYLLSADDFGVMRASAVSLQADNDALAARRPAQVQRAFDQVVRVGLVVAFEHQGRRYVCQPDWQRWQKIGYSRATNNPKPPDDVLAICSVETRALFASDHPGGFRKIPKDSGKHSGKVSEIVPERFDNISPKPLAVSRKPLAGVGDGPPRTSAKGPMPGFPRLRIFRWMADRMVATVGSASFDVEAWLLSLEQDASIVIPITDAERWAWLQQALDYELRRRGLLTAATPPPPDTRARDEATLAIVQRMDRRDG